MPSLNRANIQNQWLRSRDQNYPIETQTQKKSRSKISNHKKIKNKINNN
jgi:hypothetical protein